jgi:hypothetical protein
MEEREADAGIAALFVRLAAGSSKNKTEKQELQKKTQKENQEQFDLLIENIFASYNPETPVEEDALLTVAHAIWSKRNCRESSAEMMKLNSQMQSALSLLSKSRALRKARALRSRPTGIMGHIRPKSSDLIGRQAVSQIGDHRLDGTSEVWSVEASVDKSELRA